MSFLHQSSMYFSSTELTLLTLIIANTCLQNMLLILNKAHEHFTSHSASLKYTEWVTSLMKPSTSTSSSTWYVAITPSFWCRVGRVASIPMTSFCTSLNLLQVYIF
ncbi:hypothetical protein CIPAW_04G128600 [Carya illinoinensis]|uniref:Uncharacterized protein n=1 Tax=Carya illinoinensis TaxID=32201 RepID=A0A8T1QV30_CARIL|nr:hypothetical protein CIPAW_04G128600 [Carya illinoinensis]